MQGISHREAVRLAKEMLGDVTSQELADYIQTNFGMTIKPPIVSVILGSFQERAALHRSGQVAYEKIEQWKAENPEEAKKMAAAARRKEAARRKRSTVSEESAKAPPDKGM